MNNMENKEDNLELDDQTREALIESVRSLVTGKQECPTKDELLEASVKLKKVIPYNYEAWRLHAELLLNALGQLETRRLRPDETVKLFAASLREDELRDAAEAALRQCAHFADNTEKRILLIDKANYIRRTTWF